VESHLCSLWESEVRRDCRNIIASMKCAGLIFVHDDVEQISFRRLKDKSRVRAVRSRMEIESEHVLRSAVLPPPRILAIGRCFDVFHDFALHIANRRWWPTNRATRSPSEKGDFGNPADHEGLRPASATRAVTIVVAPAVAPETLTARDERRCSMSDDF
jgi:hypothetical protein